MGLSGKYMLNEFIDLRECDLDKREFEENIKNILLKLLENPRLINDTLLELEKVRIEEDRCTLCGYELNPTYESINLECYGSDSKQTIINKHCINCNEM